MPEEPIEETVIEAETVSEVETQKESPKKEFSIPEKYKDRSWAKKVKSEEDLYKQIDNLDKTVGKKNVPFDFENATPEEIKAHYSINKPESPTDYDLEGVVSEENAGKVQELLHEANLDKHQADTLTKSYVKWEKERMEKAQDAGDWDNILKNMYGEDHKKASGETANIIGNNLNQTHKDILEKEFTNRHLEVVYALAKNLAANYGAKESDKGVGGEGGVVTDVVKTRAEIRQELQKLSARPHTKEEHDALVNKLTKTYKK